MQSLSWLKRYGWRLMRLGIFGSLLIIAFIAGAVVALRVTLPFVMIGGILNIATASMPQMLGVLVSGPSPARLEILQQLTSQFGQTASPPMDETVWEYLRPGIEACTLDADPEVVRLAQDLIDQAARTALHEVTPSAKVRTP